jgi:DNA-binding transcriptional LysR family regulator
MRAFVAVVEAGSFVRAAEALDLSKTAVSRLVGELESRLGTRLLHRTTRKLSLTPEGEVFYARCRQLLAGVVEAEAELLSHPGDAVGQLRVNVPVTFGLLHLAPLWPRFVAHAVYPSRKYLTPKVRALIDFLAGAFNERAWPA